MLHTTVPRAQTATSTPPRCHSPHRRAALVNKLLQERDARLRTPDTSGDAMTDTGAWQRSGTGRSRSNRRDGSGNLRDQQKKPSGGRHGTNDTLANMHKKQEREMDAAGAADVTATASSTRGNDSPESSNKIFFASDIIDASSGTDIRVRQCDANRLSLCDLAIGILGHEAGRAEENEAGDDSMLDESNIDIRGDGGTESRQHSRPYMTRGRSGGGGTAELGVISQRLATRRRKGDTGVIGSKVKVERKVVAKRRGQGEVQATQSLRRERTMRDRDESKEGEELGLTDERDGRRGRQEDVATEHLEEQLSFRPKIIKTYATAPSGRNQSASGQRRLEVGGGVH